MTLLADLVAAAADVAGTSSRTAKVSHLATLLRHLEPQEIEPTVAMLAGAPRQGRVGVGWAGADGLVGHAAEPSLTIDELDRLLGTLVTTTGPGSKAGRQQLLADFSTRATPAEADFLRRLLTGELRHGALDGIVTDAVAKASRRPAADVRRAAMLTGDLARTACLALGDDEVALTGVRLTLGTPIAPMLASTANDVTEAIGATGPASVEWKLDGIRVQVHRDGDDVRLFTRNLNDVSDRLPGVSAHLHALAPRRFVLDGEALDIDGRPQAFFFDCMHLDGDDLLDLPLGDRLDALHSVGGLPTVTSIRTDDPDRAQAVLDEAVASGHEGAMAKSLASTYEAGRRGKAWRKVKPVHTLDLVVLAVEWGSGRRRGTLSNLHLGALDRHGMPVMVGKTFKGLTDELLTWQTERFLGLETRREGHVVHVRPEQVVEIALDGAHVSTRYPGGVALRFARVRRYRDDKTAAEADTLDAIRALLPRPSRSTPTGGSGDGE